MTLYLLNLADLATTLLGLAHGLVEPGECRMKNAECRMM